MEIFKLDPEKFKLFKRKVALRSLILFPVYIIIAFIINYNSGKSGGDNNLLLYLVIILVLTGIFSVYSNLKRLGKYEAVYRLKMDNDKIIVQQFRFNDIQLLKEEITGIYANPNGGFRITSNDPQKTINIHPAVEREAELSALLGQFTPVKPLNQDKKKAFLQYSLVVLVLFGMIAAFSINNPWIAVPGGLLSAGYLVYAFILIQRSKVIGNDLKQKSWWFILPFLALVAAVYAKLFP